MQPIGGNKLHNEMDESWLANAKPANFVMGDETARNSTRGFRKASRLTRAVLQLPFLKRRAVQLLILAGAVTFGSSYLIKDSDKNRIIASMTSQTGFEASKLVVNGNVNLDINILQARLATQLGNSLFSFEVDAAREEVLNDPWVKSATIRKVYPDTIVVDVIERKPVALWQSKGELHLIASDGFVIAKAEQSHMSLPQVVGEGANMVAAEFLSVMNKYPAISQKASAYVRVAGRRWNLSMENGIQVLLPASDWEYALNDLQDLQNKKTLLDRDVLQIDMRLPDRLVIKLDPEMAEIRKTAIQESLKRKWHKT